MNITVMNLTDDFMPCVDTMLVNNATGYYYWKLTGDDDGVARALVSGRRLRGHREVMT